MAGHRRYELQPWTDTRIAKLKELWFEGYSAADVANRLGGTTRNAVLGKAHRLGIANRQLVKSKHANRATTARKRKKPRPKPTVERKVNAIAIEPFVPRAETYTVPLEKRVGVQGLEDDQCRWPIGDPQDDDFHFCDQKKMLGSSYCEHHHRVATEPPRPRARRTNRAYPRPKLEVVNG